MYSLLLALIYLAFISLGLPDSLLGAGWPVMHQDLAVPISNMGMVTMAISASTICASFLSERMTKRFGTRAVTIVSVFLTAAALLGFSTANRFWMLLLWAVPYGLGGGAIDAALNNYVALHYNSRQMSWLHCFWGFGAIASPYVMSYCLTNATWHTGYRLIGILQFAIGIVLVLTLRVWNIHSKQDAQVRQGKTLGLKGVMKISGVRWWLPGFLCYCAAESTGMVWTCSYLVEARHFGEEQAAAMAALFYIGMTVGRFSGGFISDRLGDKNMIRVGAGVAVLGVVLLLLPVEGEAMAAAALLLIGLGCAPIYPSIIHATPNQFGVENSQAIIGIQMAFAYMGSALMPPLFGIVAQYVSMHLMPVYLGLFLVLSLLLLEKTYNICKKRG